MIYESQVEAQPSTRPSCLIAEFFTDCWECMADFFNRAGIYLTNCWYATVEWFDDNVNCCCRSDESSIDMRPREKPTRHSLSKQVAVKYVTRKSLVKSENTSEIKSKIERPLEASNIPQLRSPDFAATPPQPQTIITDDPTNMPVQPGKVAQKMFTRTTVQSMPTDSDSQGSVSLDPPKIDFVETGSIFGDRKKLGVDHNMFRLENGRFRSPGLSKTIPGPNGRAIRVSFVTGFPQMKSLDSSKSLPSIASRRSKRSLESSSGLAPGKGSLEAHGSRKSLAKSVSSIDNNHENNSKTVNNTNNK